MIYPRPPHLSPPMDETWRPCAWCQPLYKRVEIQFDLGGVAPTVGETITGATSGDTGVVVSTVLESGTYAGSNAVGTIELSGATGVNENGAWGTDNEYLNGSAGGDAKWTLNHVGSEKAVGRLWPESQLVFRQGKYYCPDHYHWRFEHQDDKETPVNIKDR